MTNRFARLAPLVLLLLASLAGCRAEKFAAPNPYEIDRTEYPRVFEATQQILREEGFDIDRRDYRFGQVDSKPLASPTAFEPWRPTNTTGHQVVTSTINYQRRVVSVTILPMTPHAQTRPNDEIGSTTQPAPPQSFFMRVEVNLQQYEIPARQLSGTSRGPRIQDTYHEVPAELRERGVNGSYWRTLGRDPQLEQRLIAAIIRRSTLIK